MAMDAVAFAVPAAPAAAPPPARMRKARAESGGGGYGGGARASAVSSVQSQTRERQVGDLFEYGIEKPVTVRRNQSALVPILLKPFAGRSVLLYQKAARLTLKLVQTHGGEAVADTVWSVQSAKGDTVLLIIGLLLSMLMIIFGSSVLLHVMERFSVLVTAGAALLGWIAGEMMVTDPAVVAWVDANAKWLHSFYVAPAIGAAIVVAIGMSIAKKQGTGVATESAADS